MYSLDGPTSANWFVVTAEVGAAEFAGFETECDAARDAGYAALEDAGLPVGVKIFEKMTIGAPTEAAQGASATRTAPTASAWSTSAPAPRCRTTCSRRTSRVASVTC